MIEKMNLYNRVKITFIILLLACFHLAWDYYKGGIPTHYIMQSDDMPGISNWWNLIILPILTWIILYRIKLRVKNSASLNEIHSFKNIISRFVIALIFGMALSLFFELGTDLPYYMTLSLFIIAFFIPIYWGEYLLGYVVGTTFVFGAAIPTVSGIILTLIFALIYNLVRIVTSYFKSNFS